MVPSSWFAPQISVIIRFLLLQLLGLNTKKQRYLSLPPYSNLQFGQNLLFLNPLFRSAETKNLKQNEVM